MRDLDGKGNIKVIMLVSVEEQQVVRSGGISRRYRTLKLPLNDWKGPHVTPRVY
jgi:hypothetical protein